MKSITIPIIVFLNNMTMRSMPNIQNMNKIIYTFELYEKMKHLYSFEWLIHFFTLLSSFNIQAILL